MHVYPVSVSGYSFTTHGINNKILKLEYFSTTLNSRCYTHCGILSGAHSLKWAVYGLGPLLPTTRGGLERKGVPPFAGQDIPNLNNS